MILAVMIHIHIQDILMIGLIGMLHLKLSHRNVIINLFYFIFIFIVMEHDVLAKYPRLGIITFAV